MRGRVALFLIGAIGLTTLIGCGGEAASTQSTTAYVAPTRSDTAGKGTGGNPGPGVRRPK